MPMEMPSVLSSLVDGNTEKSLQSYLERPLIVDQGEMTAADTATTFSYLPCLSMVNTEPMWKEKLKGFLGFKADIEYTIVVNATRFQQGKYMLCFVPSCGGSVRSTNQYNAYNSLHTANLTCRTQLLRCEIDINCDTSAKLTVPYCSPLNSYPLNTPSGLSYDIGQVRLFPYVAASETCTYTIWARFTNIQFYGAALPQSGRMRSRTVQEAERDDASIGPISGTLRKISQAAGELGRIPLLTSFTSPVSFVTDVMANSAQIFGWSKPNVLSPQEPILKDRMRYATTYDGASTAAPLSMSAKNELQGLAVVTDLDEMSWDFIKTIPAYYTQFSFDTDDAQQANIASIDLRYDMSVSHTYGTQAATTFLPCTLPSIYFNKARGGFILTLKCVKTEFHSGRLQVSVIPTTGFSTTIPAYTADDSAYLHRAIIDVREGNEWSFEIPYQSVVQWRSQGGDGIKMATFRVDVLDKLCAPSTVSSSIDFLVEISGAKDLEYCFPQSHVYRPLAPSVIQSGSIKFTDTIGASKPATESVHPEAYCTGETFKSFRQLLKRLNVLSYSATTLGTEYITVLPFAWETNVVVLANGSGTTLSTDTYALMSAMFGLVRGSVRAGFATVGNPENTDKGCLVYTNRIFGGTTYNKTVNLSTTDNFGKTDPTYVGSALTHFTEIDSNLVTGFVQVPGYYSCPAASTMDTMISTFTAYSDDYPRSNTTAPGVLLNYRGVPYTANAPTFLRSGADDMSFQMFISTVPMMLNSSAGAY